MVITIGGGGVVERLEGALRIRRRCLSDAVRECDIGVDVRVGGADGGGGSGPVGGGVGGTSSAEGMLL